ncbi:serine hydrolase domain-containing protein [Catalinimonas niigatensis]|uniref:serine hydrolase domain-containing protein n=1 Tax=Catalinimonas niigatensis TaxID=1397264 RepID=UPI002665419D|nr:serine hydrolase domain-containing protein [Catalinimonas niigatensis]WPP52564.1 serine hydrolase domain-containing protein [Catalinimonas niigatensis]
MKVRLNRVIFALAYFFCVMLNAEAQPTDKTQAIGEIFSKYHAYEHFQGAVLVAEKGEVIYKNAFGLANREWNIPNQVDSRFDIASISKQFTAMLIMQFYEEGRIHLDSTISVYYPEYRRDIGNQVTIHHLLTHRSGIPNYTSIPYVWSDSLVNRYDMDQLVKKYCSGDLEFKPGTRYSYNNSGYLLLSVILEKVSGLPFEVLLQKRIFSPSKMTNSGIDDRDKILDKRAYGYVRELEKYENARPMHMANLQGAGNMYATVEDLYLWDRALYVHQLLSRKGLREMMTPYSDSSDTWIPPYSNSYGYGMGLAKVSIGRNKETEMVFHSGHIAGYSSFIARFLEDEHLVVILSNTGNVSTARMNEITQEVKNVLYGLPYEVSKRSLRTSLYEISKEKGVEEAIRQYYHLTASFPYDFENTEEELLSLGRDLMALNMKAAAIEFFKLNANVNPGWKTFHTLGDVYYEDKKYKEASYYYKKSMSVNPKKTDKEINTFNASQRALTSLVE